MAYLDGDQHRRQTIAAEVSMTAALAEFKKRADYDGYIVTVRQGEVAYEKSPARAAYDKIFVVFNPTGFSMFRQGFEAARDGAT